MSLRVRIKKRLSKSFLLESEFETSSCCLGILGASGCGKSMTLKCIAGIETPDEGLIALNGRTLFDSRKKINLKPQQRRAGYLFQNYALFPRMTVLENISAALGGPRKQRREAACAWIERLGLGGLGAQYPHRLSGGQQQRAALARMLIREPELILLDEPFSALDACLREQMQILLQDILETHGDVVLVTHNRDEAYRLCSEMLVMESGKALKKGPVREMFRRPGSVGVARLTGCKNICAVQRSGEREVYASSWGLSLRTAEKVGGEITHIGIRAHDFEPAARQSHNVLPLKVRRKSEDPFEHIVLFTNAAAQAPEEQGELWWKYSKYSGWQVPQKLYIAPENILLLVP
ncbi:MAG: ATP-binding cassette domain-containing protein [Spirochaetia bacterium]|jgi:molybdate transport system ATP-binding protein|nr:ATP-binding cassette domain-containing protein [Spirochaetia bacterium]